MATICTPAPQLSLADPPQRFVLGPQPERDRQLLAPFDAGLAVHVSLFVTGWI